MEPHPIIAIFFTSRVGAILQFNPELFGSMQVVDAKIVDVVDVGKEKGDGSGSRIMC
jgi:hypothetical protein